MRNMDLSTRRGSQGGPEALLQGNSGGEGCDLVVRPSGGVLECGSTQFQLVDGSTTFASALLVSERTSWMAAMMSARVMPSASVAAVRSRGCERGGEASLRPSGGVRELGVARLWWVAPLLP